MNNVFAELGTVDAQSIGKWGRMHEAYLKEAHSLLYHQLIQNGTLRKHLSEVDVRASIMLERMISEMAKQEGITERLKAEQPMVWVGMMNNIRNRVEEIVRQEVIDTL